MSDGSVARVVAWIAPEISDLNGALSPAHRGADELDRIRREAWEVGFTRGLEAGEAAAIGEQRPHLLALQQGVERIEAILDFLATPLAELDPLVEHELAALACTLARHVVRRELQADPGQIIAAVREAVALLPASARDVRLRLHPEDAELIRAKLAEPNADRAWAIVEDPALERGGCRVLAEYSQIDARVETRLGAAITAVLGDTRIRTETPA